MNDIEICMKITKVSWVGVCKTEKVKVKDFSWNSNGGYAAHSTNLWSMNGCIWTINQKTHQSSEHPNYQTNDIIRMKIPTKEQVLYLKRDSEKNWKVYLPITCQCAIATI